MTTLPAMPVFYARSRLLRWIAAVIALILLLAAISALIVPSYLKSTLERQVQTQTGRQFKVGKVTFNPFKLTVNLSQIQLMEADNSATAFSADNLMLRVSPMSLVRLAPVVSAVTLTHPQLQLQRSVREGSEVTNFSDVLARFAQHPSSGAPLRFAVSNMQLVDGDIELDDRVTGKQIHIAALQLGVPFLSNFPAALDVYVEPYLAATVNGSKVEIKGRSKPFSSTLDTSVAIDIDQFNLTELLKFLPKPLPYKLKSALLTTRLALNFASADHEPRISLSGTASLSDVALADRAGAELFSSKQINVALADANLVSRHIKLSDLEIVDPKVRVGFDSQGMLNWMNSEVPAKPAADPPKNPAAPTAQPEVELAQLRVKNGTLHWFDAAHATPAMETNIVNIKLDAQQLSSSAHAEPGKVKLSLGGDLQLQFDGTLNAAAGALKGRLLVSELALKTWQPYINRNLAATVNGTLGMQTELELRDGKLNLNDLSASVENLSVRATQPEFGALSAKKVALDKVALDSVSRKVSITKLSFNQVQGTVFRNTDGSINLAHWMNKPAASHPAQVKALAPNKSGTGKPAAPWQVDLNRVELADSQITFSDKLVQPAVQLNAEDVNITLDNVSSTMQQPIQLALRATINKTGKFVVDGTGSTKAIQLNLDVQNFAIATLQPYFTPFLNIQVDDGSISTKSKVGWRSGGMFTFQGGMQLANLSTSDKENADDFLKWRMLDIAGIDVNLGGKQPNITLGNISLNDFYARAILSEKGKLNLQDIVVHTKSGSAAGQAPSAATTPVMQSTSPAPARTEANAPLAINVGAIKVNNGIINYTDNFIKPHYSMRMTGMAGSVGALRSDLAQSAPVILNGKIDGEAPVSISGSFNPLFSPMLLDIRMTANGINLPRLTTYALKYAGYPIVSGELSLDVSYRLKDNQLTASNALKIDQLTFGDRVEGSNATELPVPFLVSLLTDSDGQINLDLPISGSLNDPQFSIGDLIGKVFIDLIGKALTSPFSLLAHVFDGGSSDELSYIEFDPGSASLSDADKNKLDALATALTQRPVLKLDITGRADMSVDAAGLRQHRLARQVQKISNPNGDDSSDSTVDAANRTHAIEKIYAAAQFPKPRNLIGVTQALPVDEMEKQIITNMVISEDDIRNLALKRESAVYAYLTDTGHIAPERLFSLAPRLSGAGIPDKGSVSRVDFDLRM